MKKIVSLLLVLVLALGMSSVAFAATTNIRFGDPYYSGNKANPTWSGNDYGVADFTLQKYGNEIWVPFTDFLPVLNQQGQPTGAKATPTKPDIKSLKLTVKSSVKAGSKVFDKVSIAYDKDYVDANGNAYAWLKFEFADPYVSTADDTDYEIIATIYEKGDRTNMVYTLSGTYGNYILDDIDADTDYVDIHEGYVIEAQEYVKLCEVEIGENISVWTKLFKDKKYYGVATREDDEKDDVIYTKYPDIDSIVTVKSIGLSSTAQYVTFNNYDDTFYVYGADWKYLGKSDEKVAFSSKYYLAHKQLDVDEGDEEPVDDEFDDEIPEAGPITGGDGYPENVNDNPGTGK